MPLPLALGAIGRVAAKGGALAAGGGKRGRPAPPELNVTAEGTERVQRRLAARAAELASLETQVAGALAGELRGEVPVQTGRLRRSISQRGSSVWVLAPYAARVNRRRGFSRKAIKATLRGLRQRRVWGRQAAQRRQAQARLDRG